MGIFRWSLSLPIVIRQCIKITKLPTSLYTSKYVHLCLPFMQYPLVASSQVPLNICLTFDQMQLQASSLSDQSENTSCGWKNSDIYFHKFGLNCLEILKNCSNPVLLNFRPARVPTQLSGFVCAFHPTALGSSPKHTIYAFINLLINCVMWRNENKQEAGSCPFKKPKTSNTEISGSILTNWVTILSRAKLFDERTRGST